MNKDEKHLEGLYEAWDIAWKAVCTGGATRDTAWTMIGKRITELEAELERSEASDVQGRTVRADDKDC